MCFPTAAIIHIHGHFGAKNWSVKKTSYFERSNVKWSPCALLGHPPGGRHLRKWHDSGSAEGGGWQWWWCHRLPGTKLQSMQRHTIDKSINPPHLCPYLVILVYFFIQSIHILLVILLCSIYVNHFESVDLFASDPRIFSSKSQNQMPLLPVLWRSPAPGVPSDDAGRKGSDRRQCPLRLGSEFRELGSPI